MPSSMVLSQALWTRAAASGLIDVDQHHDGAEQEAGGVGEVLAGAAGGGAVDGFEHGEIAADVGRRGEADGTGDLGGHVGEDVAIEVGP